MPHSRRLFVSQNLYAITFRTKQGLPLVTTYYMQLLLGGILARTQRDNKVTLCHDLWMPNHPHLLAVCHDAGELVKFYAEVQKKITDCLKRLMGVRKLSLWEGRPVVARIADLNAAINQVAYLYANPARANLVDSIDEYPGRNSSNIFKSLATSNDINACHTSTEYWVPPSVVPKLREPSMRLHRDQDFTQILKCLGKPHKLTIYPNAWMRCFGIETPEQVAEVNSKIMKELEFRESEYRKLRVLSKTNVIGRKALRTQRIDKAHTPPEGERRVFVIASERAVRIALIAEFRALCEICRECWKATIQGLRCDWPPGMFRPSFRHCASALS